jgi:hypothetical protein
MNTANSEQTQELLSGLKDTLLFVTQRGDYPGKDKDMLNQ